MTARGPRVSWGNLGNGLCALTTHPPAGHSHQLFHVCAVLGTHFQLEAVLADMGSRRAWLATQGPPLGLAGTAATLGLAVAGNVLIVVGFAASLFRAPSPCPLLHGGPLEGGTKAKQQAPASEAALEGGRGQALVLGRSPDPDLKRRGHL